MSFILKFVLVLLVFSFVVYVLKSIARLSHYLQGTVKEVRKMREQMGGSVPATAADMVRCAACGAFISAREAVTVSSRGRSQTFCSHECIKAHVKSA